MASVRGAFNDVAGALQAVIGLSRARRLRNQLDETIDLYEKLKEHQELSAATDHLFEAINHHAFQVKEVALRPRRKWAWGTFFVGLVFTAAIGWLTWFAGWQHREQWWGMAALVVLGLFTFVFLLATLSAARESGEKRHVDAKTSS